MYSKKTLWLDVPSGSFDPTWGRQKLICSDMDNHVFNL